MKNLILSKKGETIFLNKILLNILGILYFIFTLYICNIFY